MSAFRTALLAGLLAFSALALVPAASAEPDNVYACVTHVKGGCGNGNAVELHVKGHDYTACVIGVDGSCDPYDGDLARVDADGQQYSVPDPCYTTSCF